MRIRAGATLWGIAGSALGCATAAEVPPEPAPTCENPVTGLDRFTEEAQLRGLVPDTAGVPIDPDAPPNFGAVWAPGRLIVEDLDGDGDVDVLFSHATGLPQAFRNDGGYFEATTLGLDPTPPGQGQVRQPWATFSLVDLAGSPLPDLVLQVGSALHIAENAGDFSFEPLRTLGFASGPTTSIYSHVWGDPDADGDLDLWLPTMADVQADDVVHPAAEVFFLNRDDILTPAADYRRGGEAGLSILGVWTDRDNDGDLDMLSFSDRGREIGILSTAYRNDGVDGSLPVLVEDGSELGFSLPTSAMGLASADLNDDGILDYCVSDLGPISCLMSRAGIWVDAGTALGLVAPPREEAPWSGWSLELVDLDHDGWLDMPVVGAAQEQAVGAFGTAEEWSQPDVMYRGGPGGFETVDMEFGGFEPHPAMAAADVDGDGFQDLIVAAYDAPALLYMNRCSMGSWLTVRASGAPGNPQGLGARVTISADRTHIREVPGQRALGQGPARVHFGLGDISVVDVHVRWPDGAEVELEDVPTRQALVVPYPG